MDTSAPLSPQEKGKYEYFSYSFHYVNIKDVSFCNKQNIKKILCTIPGAGRLLLPSFPPKKGKLLYKIYLIFNFVQNENRGFCSNKK